MATNLEKEEDAEVELELCLSLGGSFKKAEKAQPLEFRTDINPKHEINGTRRKETRKKLEVKEQQRSGGEGEGEGECKRFKTEHKDVNNGVEFDLSFSGLGNGYGSGQYKDISKAAAVGSPIRSSSDIFDPSSSSRQEESRSTTVKSSATTPVETMSLHRDGSITTFLGLQLLLLFFCFLSPASFSDATIPSTLDGPFTPVTITLDTSLRGKAVDLPDTDPRVQRYVTGFQPEQISLALSSNYDSIWVSWITGEFQIGMNVTPLDPTSIASIVQFGTFGDSLIHTATGSSLVYNQLYPFEGLLNYTSGIIHHVRITGLQPSTVYYYRCGDPSHGISKIHHFKTMPVSSPSSYPSRIAIVAAQTIKSCLDNLPGYPRTQIGFITYDSTLHFYNLKSSLSQPQMMVVSDLDDIFIPLPDDLLVNLSESRNVVEAFLDGLPLMFQDNVNVESAFGPAVKAAYMVMNQLGGKLLIFQNSLPSLGAGRLKLRGDDPRVYGTDKEYALRVAEDAFYKQMAADCTKFQIAINVYAFSDKYTDIASLGTLAKYTGGQVYYYPGFQSSIHGDKLRHELGRDLTRETAWESVMRIRCGKGIRCSSYHGNFMLRSADLLALPAVDCDKAYAVQLALEETLLTTPTVYFQVALLVHTAIAPVVTDLGEMYRQADTGSIVSVAAQTIKSCLDNLPGYPRTQIGFITYDSTLHFYNLKSSLSQPQMMVVSDLDDIFIPLPDDLLVNLSESRNVVEAFLDGLPLMFQDNVNVESAFGPAVKAAYMVMNQLGGKLLIFQNSLPSLGAGRLKLRGDDPRVYGTDKEYALRVAEDTFYKQMAADCTKFQIAINVYAFSDKYTDIASLGALAKYTGGQVYYYPGFQSSIHGDKLRHELARDLTRETAWESVMRIRCGKGIRCSSYHGNFMLRSADLLALPAVDCDKAYAVQLALEETLLTTATVYFQVALLVHTAIAPVVTDLGEMYRQADTGSIVSVYARLAIEKTLSAKLDDARNAIQQKIVKALREYRNLHSVQHRLGSRLIYPESLKFLPLYGLAICKSTPLHGGPADASLDERCAAGFTMMALPVKKLLKLLYPSLFRVDEWLLKPSADHDDLKDVLRRLPLAAESLDSRGLYIYDDGFRLVLWFGRMLSPDIAKCLLGADFAAELSRVTLQEQENGMSKKLMRLIKKVRDNDPSYHPMCLLVRQGEQPREGFLLLRNLIDDQTGGSTGYVDWMLQLHRQVQQNA
ncbi:hypothetical protein F2Q70_00037634 [Brassica cretica]|uniref:Purple acid phosphatase N-terminal domain-containing protein n=1 Tax=Brassica cretica TaxID=69181 RepID=A0A8S9JPF3_BRACR|nr:hypothetical protein F2Q70_00037634 [Brassica cretica]